MPADKKLKICSQGHPFYKSSDCPSCPVCEKEKAPDSGFLSSLSSPARNALLHYGIETIEQLAGYTEKEILRFHGIGKASLPVFHRSLAEKGLSFKPEE